MRSFRLEKGRKENGQHLAEFGPVLLVIFIVILFPLIDLVTYICGVSTVQLVVTEASRAAAVSETPKDALDLMVRTVGKVSSGGLGALTKLGGVGGHQATGCDLKIKVTNTLQGNSQTFDLPAQFPLPEDFRPEKGNNKSDLIYQYQVRGRYVVSPLVDMSGIPGLKGTPILSPTEVTYNAETKIENLAGLNSKTGI